MNQAELTHLMSGLRVKLNTVSAAASRAGHRPRKLKQIEGPRGQILKLQKTVHSLVVNERLELTANLGALTRMYAERLISDAVTFGDRHKHTMEMAQWWLKDEFGNQAAVHKLFKVLVPRFADFTTCYTRILNAPILYDPFNDNRRIEHGRVMLELKGNPFPKLDYSNVRPNKRHIHNLLLEEAKNEYKKNLANKDVKPAVVQDATSERDSAST